MAKRSRSGDSRTAVAYLRVSTEDQNLGPEAQRTAIEAWAVREGARIASWHEDHGVSGAAPIEARPAMTAALAALRELGAGVLVVAKRDRIARDPYVACAVERAAEKAGARVVSAAGEGTTGDGAADVFMRRILDGAAEYERGLIRARTKAALGVKKTRGERVGEVPYGFRVVAGSQPPRLEEDPAEQAVLGQVRELRTAGLSQRAIAAELATRGMLSRSARPFGQTQIARMLGGAR